MSLACGIDVETTGFSSSRGDEVIEVAAVLLDIERGTVVASYSTLVRPTDLDGSFADRYAKALAVNRINPADLEFAPSWKKVVGTLKQMTKGSKVFVMHNETFDLQWLREVISSATPTLCTMKIHEVKYGRRVTLSVLAKDYELSLPTHRAAADAECTVRVAWKGKYLRPYR